jgi:hypothetical protein
MRGFPKGSRKITVSSQTFAYKVGRRFTQIWRHDRSTFLRAENWKVRGDAQPYNFERGQWKRSSDGTVAPSHVAQTIRAVLAL